MVKSLILVEHLSGVIGFIDEIFQSKKAALEYLKGKFKIDRRKICSLTNNWITSQDLDTECWFTISNYEKDKLSSLKHLSSKDPRNAIREIVCIIIDTKDAKILDLIDSDSFQEID